MRVEYVLQPTFCPLSITCILYSAAKATSGLYSAAKATSGLYSAAKAWRYYGIKPEFDEYGCVTWQLPWHSHITLLIIVDTNTKTAVSLIDGLSDLIFEAPFNDL